MLKIILIFNKSNKLVKNEKPNEELDISEANKANL